MCNLKTASQEVWFGCVDHFRVIDSMWTQVTLKFVTRFVLSQHQGDDDETPSDADL